MKAQSAIEYLSTYGWMLVVVAVVGGAIYGVAGERCTETVSGFSGGIMVADFSVNSETDNLDILIENQNSDTALVKNVTINSADKQVTQELNSEIEAGSSETVPLSEGFATSPECNTYDITVTYDQDSLTNMEVTGTITGGLEIVELPKAPEIETVAQ